MNFIQDFAYIEATIPAGVTLADYRASRPPRRRRWRQMRRAMGLRV